MKKIINIILISTILIGCKSTATFSNYDTNKEYKKLTETSLHELNGVYKHYAHKRLFNDTYPKINSKKYLRMHTSILNQVKNKNYYLARAYDTISKNQVNNYYVKIKIINTNKIEILFCENSKVLRSLNANGKLINGIFNLDNDTSEYHGTPWIAGGGSSSKRRIGISKNGNLIVNDVSRDYGAFLFVFFGGDTSNSTTYEYERIN